MTQMMTEEDASSLSSTLKENYDAFKDYMADYVRYLQTQVRIYSYLSLVSPNSPRGVFSTLDSGSRGPGSSPGRVMMLCFRVNHYLSLLPPAPPPQFVLYKGGEGH